jgi:hypothetical protein
MSGGIMNSENEAEAYANLFIKKLFIILSVSMALFMGSVIVFVL